MKQELKTVNPHFQQIWDRKKTFEIRKDDRGYKVGDILFLREYTKGAVYEHGVDYSGRIAIRTVSHILRDAPECGLAPGYCILSFEPEIDTNTNE